MSDASMHVVRCNFCGAGNSGAPVMRKPEVVSGHGEAVLYRCAACNGVFLGSSPTDYQEDLYSYYERYRTKTRSQLYPAVTRSRNLDLLRRFGAQLLGKDVLDVGCGMGGFIEAALAEGWNCEGIDLAEPAVRIGQGHGLPVYCKDFFSAEIKEKSKDLITMFEVIEHVPNPAQFLIRAEAVLRENGLVYVTTPNFDSLDRRVLGTDWEAIHVEHLNYFTSKTLAAMVRSATSLELVSLKTKNLSTSLTRKLLSVPRVGWRRTVSTAQTNAPSMTPQEAVENSTVLRLGKSTANLFLTTTGMGTTINMLLRKKSH